MVLVYTAALRYVPASRIRSVMGYVQMALSFAIYGSYALLLDKLGPMFDLASLPSWTALLPPAWFASLVGLAAGEWTGGLLAGLLLSLVSLVLLLAAIGGRQPLEAPDYRRPRRCTSSVHVPGFARRGAAVVCHPHPVFGGTMDNRVVYRAAKAAAGAGFAALRFNFRGAGQSTGQFDEGIGEREDAIAAIAWLANRYPALNLAMIGYSFGAWVGLEAGYSVPRVQALVGLGLPLDKYDLEYLTSCSKPALYIVGTNDEFCSKENLDRFAERLPPTAALHRIDGSDHFFTGHIEAVERLISGFFQNL